MVNPDEEPSPPPAPPPPRDPVRGVIAATSLSAGQLGWSGCAGACCGYAFREVSRRAAYYVGVSYFFLQAAQYSGLVEIRVRFDKLVDSPLFRQLDADGDGEITQSDVLTWWDQLVVMMTHNVGNAGGFASGFYLGLRYV